MRFAKIEFVCFNVIFYFAAVYFRLFLLSCLFQSLDLGMEKVDTVEYLDEYLTGKTWFSYDFSILYFSFQLFVAHFKIRR